MIFRLTFYQEQKLCNSVIHSLLECKPNLADFLRILFLFYETLASNFLNIVLQTILRLKFCSESQFRLDVCYFIYVDWSQFMKVIVIVI